LGALLTTEDVRLDQARMSRYESGRSEMPMSLARRAVDLLGSSMGFLYGDHDNPYGDEALGALVPRRRRMLDAILDALEPEEQERVSAYLVAQYHVYEQMQGVWKEMEEELEKTD
jgi:hypothetical protein